MAEKLEGDITRKAVELATKSIALATEKLKLIVTTGPDQVMMTRKQIEDGIAGGNTGLLPYAEKASGQSANTVDNDLLERMAARGQIRGKM